MSNVASRSSAAADQDGDGAVAPEGSGLDRRSFLRRGALAGVGMTSVSGLLAACGGDDTRTSAVGQTTKLDEFNFSFPIPIEDSQHATWFVNKALFAKQERIDLKFHAATSASDFVKRVASGDYQAAHPSPFLLATLVDAGLPVRIYFDMMAKNIFGFAVLEDSPIQRMQDMKGTTIAALAVGQEVIWNPGLARAGVDPDDVKYRVVGLGGARLQALQSGRTDAMVTWDPDYVTAQTLSRAAGQKPVRFLTPGALLPDAVQRLGRLQPRPCRTRSSGMSWSAPPARRRRPCGSFGRTPRPPRRSSTRSIRASTLFRDKQRRSPRPTTTRAFTEGPEGTTSKGLGFNSPERWRTLLADMRKNELIKKDLGPDELSTNDLVAEINDFNKDEVVQFAKDYRFTGTRS
jgi:hypothetical protein